MSPNPGGPPDPTGKVDAGMIGLHELFLSLQRAGFAEQQALYLVGQMLRGAQGEAPRGDGGAME